MSDDDQAARHDHVSHDAPAAPMAPPRMSVVQRRHLRRILVCFVVVVVLLPISGLGGAAAWLLVPMLVGAAIGLREAILLRRTITRSAPQ